MVGRGSKYAPVAPATPPSWVATARSNGWSVGQFARISGASPSHGLSATNTCFAVAPSGHATLGNQAGVMSAWGGSACASGVGTHGKQIFWNGGHTDYQGNEVYAFDYSTRTWARITECSPDAVFDYSGLPGGMYAAHGLQVNGSPAPPHVYSMVRYDPVRQSFYTFLTQTANTPSYTPHCCELPLSGASQYVWQSRATAGFTLPAEGWSCYDSVRARHIVHGASGAAHTLTYTPATNAWAQFIQADEQWAQDSYTVGAHDPVNDFVMAIRPNGTIYGIDAGDLTSVAATLTTSGKPTITSSGGFEYSAERGGFIWHKSDTDEVYLITKGVGTWSAATWTWTLITNANAITPESMESSGGGYSKSQPMSWGTTSILFVAKRTGLTGTGAIYAMLLST